MTPAARLAAAIAILEQVREGAPAERALTNWGRASRFAGSGDRAAVRDHVFDVLRCRGSFAALGGGESGRALVLGLARAQGLDIAALFTGEGHAPAPLSAQEAARLAQPLPDEGTLADLDWPDWLRPQLQADLGAAYAAVSARMRARAPVFLRVNLARGDRAAAQAALALEGIATRPDPLAETALEVTGGARRVQASAAYRDGLVELQDAASQAAIAQVPVAAGMRVLDYCAGGGGKALALAARAPKARIEAHDIDPGRMRDIPVRAARAGARISTVAPGRLGRDYDLVLVDAPCSGSGTWRRTPEAKWRLTPERLAELCTLQAQILRAAAARVAPGGRLLYMTCSLLDAENAAQVEAFVRETGWQVAEQRRFTPLDGGDGFFAAQLERRD
ncbi:RsmB/NOP family class I SAM-dependent RNA methyltransferase [Sinirhodobacter huangdaonensis]|uniref:RsmB/NOP family class I SAM-dependent RNA methyltransferase n=1 Tax=Paenirhodobacter huangdaonensis TaxID=2501515 RepID=A0A3S4MJP5_9RHOB|nr:RsmB/NOP family class I SAM-dependent RNA methyltransferase [Sinirhodobacter huangdaonensis]RWR54045.1 RsmB/NOP family class I SAM-dependent RNA methyltransferase [Sinirhodobacter huangdaonensis]